MTTIRPVDSKRYFIPMSGDPRLHRELQWYATQDDAVLGVLILDLVDLDFSWVVLTQNNANDAPPGAYSGIDLDHSLPSREAATQALHTAMTQAAQQQEAKG